MSSRPMNLDFSEKFTHRTKSGLIAEIFLTPFSALKLFGEKINPLVETRFLADGADLESMFQCRIESDSEYGT